MRKIETHFMSTTFYLCFVGCVLCTFLNLYTEQFGMVTELSLPVSSHVINMCIRVHTLYGVLDFKTNQM